MCAWRVDQMVDEISRAASTLNNAFVTHQAMSGKFPKQLIEESVERWYLDGKKDYEYCINIIEYISNKYQKTAINHLNYIHQYGYVHLKTKKNVEYKTNVIEMYFLGLFMGWPALVGIFNIFSKDEEDKKQLYPLYLHY